MSRQVSERRASIDVGTNSVRLLVADVHPDGRVCALIRKGLVTRLGEGLDATGLISPVAAERTVQAIDSVVAEARSAGAARIRMAGTSALRSASNGAQLVEEIDRRTGLQLRVLSGKDEARLVYRSIHGAADAGDRAIVLDIGGGSTELAVGTGPEPSHCLSLEVGCVRLYERTLEFGGVEAPEGYTLARATLNELLKERVADHRREYAGARVRGVGGTLTAFAMLFRQEKSYDPDVLEGTRIPAPDQARISQQLRKMTLQERREWVGGGRADLVSAGAAILDEVMSYFEAPEVEVSTRGLRYGLLLDA